MVETGKNDFSPWIEFTKMTTAQSPEFIRMEERVIAQLSTYEGRNYNSAIYVGVTDNLDEVPIVLTQVLTEFYNTSGITLFISIYISYSCVNDDGSYYSIKLKAVTNEKQSYYINVTYFSEDSSFLLVEKKIKEKLGKTTNFVIKNVYY